MLLLVCLNSQYYIKNKGITIPQKINHQSPKIIYQQPKKYIVTLEVNPKGIYRLVNPRLKDVIKSKKTILFHIHFMHA